MRSGNMPQSLYQNWQFAIEVNGFDVALFKKGQEPKTEFEEVAFSAIAYKLMNCLRTALKEQNSSVPGLKPSASNCLKSAAS